MDLGQNRGETLILTFGITRIIEQESIDLSIWGSADGTDWGAKPLKKLSEDEAVSIALRALDTAAESDTSTGGVDRSGKIYPLIKIVSGEGITTLPETKIAAVFKKTVA